MSINPSKSFFVAHSEFIGVIMGFGAIALDALHDQNCSRTTYGKTDRSSNSSGERNMGSGKSSRAFAKRTELSLGNERAKDNGSESFMRRRFGTLSISGVKSRLNLASVSFKGSPKQASHNTEFNGFNDISHSTSLADPESKVSTLESSKPNHCRHLARNFTFENEPSPDLEDEKSEELTWSRRERVSTYDSLHMDEFDLNDFETFDEREAFSMNSMIIKPVALRIGGAPASRDPSTFSFGVDPDFLEMKAGFTTKRNRRLGDVTAVAIQIS